jgi:hypothetical protein
MRKKTYRSVLTDKYGQEYQIVGKRLPGQRKNVYGPYVIRKKRLGKDFWIDIALQWLIRLIVSLLPVGDWSFSE